MDANNSRKATENESLPSVDEKPVPLWIKIMWVIGVSWVLIYIYEGLKSTPKLW